MSSIRGTYQRQADAGHEEAALKEPHPPADVVSSTTKIIFSYLKAANCCPIYLFIAAPFVLSVVLYLIISQHPFNENILLEMLMKNFCEFVKAQGLLSP